MKIEAGLNEKKAAEKLVQSGLYKDCFRILIEPEPEILKEAVECINEIEEVLDRNNVEVPRLLHGFNSVSWELLRVAKRRGYDSRIGMEDTIYLENGVLVKNNLELINYAQKILIREL